VFFIITGGLGMAAANNPSDCSIITLMVFSIISAVMGVPHMVLDGFGADQVQTRTSYYFDYSDTSRYESYQVEAVWLYSVLFILGLAVAIISIVLSSYTCRAICCRRSNAGSVIHNPSGVDATAQAIPLGNLDLSKAVLSPTASTAPESQELLAPSYNALAKKMYGDHFKKFFPKKAVMGMSIAMIIAGALSAILQIPLLFKSHYVINGQGIWCGVFFIITGGLGIAAASKPSDCSNLTLMVFSIISALMAVPRMGFDAFGISSPSSRYQVDDVWLYSFLFILGLAGATISIVLSSYTCCAVCCPRSNAGSVIYNPSGAAATAQTIPLGHLDLSKVIVTQPAAAAATSHQLPPSYNAVTQLQMHNPPSAPPTVGQTNLENRALVNGNFQPKLFSA